MSGMGYASRPLSPRVCEGGCDQSEERALLLPDWGLREGRGWVLVTPPPQTPASNAGPGDILLRKPRPEGPEIQKGGDRGSWL